MRLSALCGVALFCATAVSADPFQQLQSSVAAQGGALTRLNGAGYLISLAGVDITAARIVLAGDAVVLSSVEVKEANNAAFIRAEQITASTADALSFLAGQPLCAAAPLNKDKLQLGARNISFQPSDSDISLVSESVIFERLGVSFMHDGQEVCSYPDGVVFEKMQVRSADGATGQVEKGSGSFALEGGSVRLAMTMDDITSLDRRTGALVRIGSSSMALTADESLAGHLAEMQDFQSLFDQMMVSGADLDLSLTGILLEDIQGTTLPAAINGDAVLRLALKDGDISLNSSSDLVGLFAGDAQLALRIVESGTMSGLSMMLGDRVEAAIADRLSFLGGRAAFEDKGVVALLERAGYSKDDILAGLSRRMGPVPAAMAEPVLAFFSDALEGSARVTAAPEGPVSTAQLIMAGLMSPASISQLLGLSRD